MDTNAVGNGIETVGDQVLRLQAQDRFFGRIAAVRSDLQRERLSAACAGLDFLRADALSRDASGQLAQVDQEVEDTLRRAVAEIVRLITAADAPAAAALVGRLLAGPHPRVERALSTLARARGWPRLCTLPPLTDRSLGAPSLLVDGRHVRLWFHAAWRDGTVTGATDGHEITVRVEAAGGVFFPTVPRASVVPAEPTAAELRDQVRAALAAGDSDLAAAWLAVCVSRGVELDSPMARCVAPWFRFE